METSKGCSDDGYNDGDENYDDNDDGHIDVVEPLGSLYENFR